MDMDHKEHLQGAQRQWLGVSARVPGTARQAPTRLPLHSAVDECYLDLTAEAQRVLAACGGEPPLPVNIGALSSCAGLRKAAQQGMCAVRAAQYV